MTGTSICDHLSVWMVSLQGYFPFSYMWITYFPTKFSRTELFPALWPPTTAIWGRSRLAFCPIAEKASCSLFTRGIRSSIPLLPIFTVFCFPTNRRKTSLSRAPPHWPLSVLTTTASVFTSAPLQISICPAGSLRVPVLHSCGRSVVRGLQGFLLLDAWPVTRLP